MTLDTWGPVDNLFPSIYDALQSNWGEYPSRTVNRPRPDAFDQPVGAPGWKNETGWDRLLPHEQAYVESCFAGKTLQQVLERITFSFTVDGATRAFTHEFVRARIGSGFMQHGGRDNDWRHRDWTMPETMERACLAEEARRHADMAAIATQTNEFADAYPTHVRGRKVCVKNWDALAAHLASSRAGLREVITDYLEDGKRLYAALVDAGIPWQDARRLLHIGTQTYIHGDFNFVALKAVLANRLEFIMDWEINCVAQLMHREVALKCPPLFAKALGSHSDMAGYAKFAGLESWPPDGKYPVNADVAGTPRTHDAEQMPFWVLHPDCYTDATKQITWVPTNGHYDDARAALAKENE